MTATGLLVRPVGAHADNDPLNKVDPSGMRPGDAQFRYHECDALALIRCSYVVDDTDSSLRSSGYQWDDLTNFDLRYMPGGFRSASQQAASMSGVDQALIFGSMAVESGASGVDYTYNRPANIAQVGTYLVFGREGSIGPTSMPLSLINTTVDRHPELIATMIANGGSIAEAYTEAGRLGYAARRPGWVVQVSAFRFADLEGYVHQVAGGYSNVEVIPTKDFNGLYRNDEHTRYYAMSALVHQGYRSALQGELKIFDALVNHTGFDEDLRVSNPYGSNVYTTQYTAGICAGNGEFGFSNRNSFCP